MADEKIVLNALEVYTSSDGTGGTGEALAKSIYSDLEKNAGLEGISLLQVQGQGRVMDGQYINTPFIDNMSLFLGCLKMTMNVKKVSGGLYSGILLIGSTKFLASLKIRVSWIAW